jgi:hypothetical protein
MPANGNELSDLQERIRSLSVTDQLYLLARIADGLRREHFTDHEADEKAAAAFAEHYVATEGHKAPYPVPPEILAQIPQCDVAKSTS